MLHFIFHYIWHLFHLVGETGVRWLTLPWSLKITHTFSPSTETLRSEVFLVGWIGGFMCESNYASFHLFFYHLSLSEIAIIMLRTQRSSDTNI